MRLEITISWGKQTNKQQQQEQQKQKQAKTKTKKQNRKQKTVTTEKVIPFQLQPIFLRDLSQVVYLFLSQKSA